MYSQKPRFSSFENNTGLLDGETLQLTEMQSHLKSEVKQETKEKNETEKEIKGIHQPSPHPVGSAGPVSCSKHLPFMELM